MLNRVLRRLGYQLVATGQASPNSRASAAERTAVDQAIRQFVASLPAGDPLGDVSQWRDYLSNERMGFFGDVVRLCDEAAVDLDGKRVADVGTGTGYLLRRVGAEAPTADLIGYDTFEGVLPLARLVCPQATFEALGLEEIEAAHDVVFCTEVLEHLVAPESAVRKLAAIVRPGGALVLTTPDGRRDQQEAGEPREDGAAYWGHINFWSPESWKLFLERSLPSGTRLQCGALASGENYAVAWL